MGRAAPTHRLVYRGVGHAPKGELGATKLPLQPADTGNHMPVVVSGRPPARSEPCRAQPEPGCGAKTPNCSSTANSSQYCRRERIRLARNSAIVTPFRNMRIPVASIVVPSGQAARYRLGGRYPAVG